MKDTTESQKKWKAEEMREERKARLAQMKSKNGGKKPVRSGSRLAAVITIAVLVVLLLVAGLWGAVRLGLPQQHLAAMTVGDENIKVVEFNYYYHNLAGQFQLDPNDPASAQTLKSDSGIEGYETVEDYIKDVAAQQAQMNVMLASMAKQDGLSLDDEDRAVIDDFYTQIETNAAQQEISTNAYLVSLFGRGASKDSMQPILERYLLAQKYSTEKQASFTFEDDEIENYYQENKDNYDRVSYRLFTVKADYDSDSTDEEKEAAMLEAKEKASEMLSAVSDDESFKQACIDFAADDDERLSYESSDKSKLILKLKSSISGSDASDWLFDSGRSENDKTIIEASAGYQVILFLERSESDFSYVNANHILISADRNNAEAAEIAEAKETAESIYAEYLAGDKSQESFAELAKEHSLDSSAANGGLIEGIYPGQMVAEFEHWLFESGRKVGDTDIVQTDYGFHIMYYAGTSGDSDRHIRIESELRSQAYEKYVEESLINYPYSINSFGYRFTT